MVPEASIDGRTTDPQFPQLLGTVVYVEALLHPDRCQRQLLFMVNFNCRPRDRIKQSVELAAESNKAHAEVDHSKNTVLANADAPSPDEARNALNQPFNEWVERMNVILDTKFDSTAG